MYAPGHFIRGDIKLKPGPCLTAWMFIKFFRKAISTTHTAELINLFVISVEERGAKTRTLLQDCRHILRVVWRKRQTGVYLLLHSEMSTHHLPNAIRAPGRNELCRVLPLLQTGAHRTGVLMPWGYLPGLAW